MAYFGPQGIGEGRRTHPSLRTYIECFLSPPFPKMFPRGGGVWDQDPILMRDFRVIRKFDLEWKHAQQEIDAIQSGSEGGGGLAGSLNDFLEELGEDGYY